jgi:hypothetical protein
MKIYTSTEYIEPKDEKVGMLQLEVINMWDFLAEHVAYETIYKGEPNEKDISFRLKRCIAVIEPKWTKWEDVKLEDITEEMVTEMERMGLYVNKSALNSKPPLSSEQEKFVYLMNKEEYKKALSELKRCQRKLRGEMYNSESYWQQQHDIYFKQVMDYRKGIIATLKTKDK